ncbi:MaoC family dehydratase [Hyphobacterium marinum]|uniref:MaoC family dehydratase n=1 Tax=Hyphobacterium marinum TaxID=3116574 RepID=A0ABU7LWL6_9PROT|nr:MaoC family dehydratase [Hyphobacterium sp. Y6023]MEE2565947.1 MaoC family dehydratase [Hyphobacterium sp. Y6023]
MSHQEPIPLEDIQIGQSAEMTRHVDDATVRAFAEVSGDFNPLHLDEDYARRTPFRGRIAHGALIASFLSGVLGNQLPGPGAIFVRMDIGFQRPVRIGDTLVAKATVKAIDMKTRIVTMDCACTVGDDIAMTAVATVMVRTRRRKTAG